MRKITLVSIFYNEEECIDYFIERTIPILKSIKKIDYEIIFINDRSTDNSLQKLISHHKKNNKIKIINMARRFGPMESIMAGVRASSGDALINIDIDMQDPPELIPEMIKFWLNDSYDVVYTTRTKRLGEGFIKPFISNVGYRILKFFTYVPMEKDSGDFRLISRRVIDEYKKFGENLPFFRFIVDWIGFERKQIFYEREPRRYGKTGHPLGLGVIFNFFEISLTPFTDFPVRFSLMLGFISFFISFIVVIRTLYLFFSGEDDISTTSMFVAILIFGSIQSLILGFLGLYIGSIHRQVKNRPLYIIDNVIGLNEEHKNKKDNI